MEIQFGQIPTEGDIKAQWIRKLDILVIAPLMIYVGARKDVPSWMRQLLFLFGISTALYNAHNYMEIEKRKKEGGML